MRGNLLRKKIQKFYGKNNIILHGHTHRLRNEVIKQTFIFNPGECAGMMKGKNSVGIIDSDHLKMNVINF